VSVVLILTYSEANTVEYRAKSYVKVHISLCKYCKTYS